MQKSRNDFRKVIYRILNFNITDIDIKKGTYDLSIRHNFAYSYKTKFNSTKENHPILDIAIGTIIYFNEDQEKHMYHICNIPEKVVNDEAILVPENIVSVQILGVFEISGPGSKKTGTFALFAISIAALLTSGPIAL